MSTGQRDAFRLQLRIAAIYQDAEKHGVSRPDVDAIASTTIGRDSLKAASDGHEVTRVETAIRTAVRAKAEPAPIDPGRVDTATGEIGPEPPASARQVEYIADLLADRVRSGEGGGFFATGAFLTGGGAGRPVRIDMDAIRALSRSRASQLIASLKGEY